MSDTRIRITLDLIVTDAEALRAYAKRRVRAAWNERLDVFARTEAEWVYEALIGSSEGPPMIDFGLELDLATAEQVDENGEAV